MRQRQKWGIQPALLQLVLLTVAVQVTRTAAQDTLHYSKERSRSVFPYTNSYRTNPNPYWMGIDSVTQQSAGDKVCLKLYSEPKGCAGASGVSDTCCNALSDELHKLEIEIRPRCHRHSVQSATVNGEPKSFLFIADGQPTAVFKITALRLSTADTEEGVEVCFTLGDRCKTLAEFSANGRTLRWAALTQTDRPGVPKVYSGRCMAMGERTLEQNQPLPPTPESRAPSPPPPVPSPAAPSLPSPSSPLPAPIDLLPPPPSPGEVPPSPPTPVGIAPPTPAPVEPSPPPPEPPTPSPPTLPAPLAPEPSPPPALPPTLPPSAPIAPPPGTPPATPPSVPPAVPATPPPPAPPSPPVEQLVIPFPTPDRLVDPSTSNLQLQLYAMDLSDSTLEVTVQATVMDVGACTAGGAFRNCDTLNGLGLAIDPNQYGGFEGLLDPSQGTVRVTDGISGNNFSVATSTSPIPVIAVQTGPGESIRSNRAMRATFVLPRVVPDPTDAPDPTPTAHFTVVAWGATTRHQVLVSVANPVLNTVILNNGTSGTAPGRTVLPLSSAGMNFWFTTVPGPVGTGTQNFVISARGPPPDSEASIELGWQMPLYVRVPLQPGVARVLVRGNNSEPGALASLPAGVPAVTFTAAPTEANSLVYQMKVPAGRSVSSVCALGEPGQPDGTCFLELIGSGGFTWRGVIPSGSFPPAPPQPPMPPPPPPGGDPIDQFTLFELPPQRMTFNDTNFGAQLYRLVFTPEQVQVTYQVSAADIQLCNRFTPQHECNPIHGFGAFLDPEIFGTDWDLSTLVASVDPATRAVTTRTGVAADGTPMVGMEMDPPMGSNEVSLIKFVVTKAGLATPQGRRRLAQTTLPAGNPLGQHPTVVWGPDFVGQKSVATAANRTVFNPVILNNPDFVATSDNLRPLSDSGLVTWAGIRNQDPSRVYISLGDPRFHGAPGSLRRPLYVRLFLTPGALAGTITGSARPASPAASAYFSQAGMDVTWTVGPPPQNTFNYTYTLPDGVVLGGPAGATNVCLQGAVEGQPDNTCVYQVISADGTAFQTFLTPEQLGLVTDNANLQSEAVGLIVGETVYTPATETAWGVQVYNASENATHVSVCYLIDVGALDTCSSAGLQGCSTYSRTAYVLNATELAGTDLLAATVANRDWAGLPGTPAVNTTSSPGGAVQVTVFEPGGREVGADGPTAQLYKLVIPKREGTGTVLTVQRNGVSRPPSTAVLVTGRTTQTVVTLGGLQDPAPAFNPMIMNDASYTPPTNLALSGQECLRVSLARAVIASPGTGAPQTELSVDVDALTDVPSCRTFLNATLQRPVYLRMRLSSRAAAAAASTVQPHAGSVVTPAAADAAPGFAAALTWPYLPSWGNRFRYSLSAEGVLAVNDLCAQSQHPEQVLDSCFLQVISGGNNTVWAGVVRAPGPPADIMPPAPPQPPPFATASPGLNERELAAVVTTSVLGGLCILGLLGMLLVVWHRNNMRKWAPAKALGPGADGSGTNSHDMHDDAGTDIPDSPHGRHGPPHPPEMSLPNLEPGLSPHTSIPPSTQHEPNSPLGGAASQVSGVSYLRPTESLASGAPSTALGAGTSLLGGGGSTISGVPSTFLPVPPSTNIERHINFGHSVSQPGGPGAQSDPRTAGSTPSGPSVAAPGSVATSSTPRRADDRV